MLGKARWRKVLGKEVWKEGKGVLGKAKHRKGLGKDTRKGRKC